MVRIALIGCTGSIGRQTADVVRRYPERFCFTALAAGHDVRFALIGAGVYASHGYERSHIKGVENTLRLIEAFAAR